MRKAGASRVGLRIYNLFPPLAGTVAEWTAELPRIARMGFNAVYLNPFHYPGFSGSIYAVKDYYRLNPAFRGDAKDSDEALLRRFTGRAAEFGLIVLMDLVLNHTSKDSELARQHPDWFRRDAAGALASPFAADPADPTRKIVWGDLTELDYGGAKSDDIVRYFGEVARHYLGLGFAGFRCDAAYKVPAAAWRALTDRTREAKPDALFCAENLGAPKEAVLALAGAGFDYLFNSVKWWDFEAPWLFEQYEAFRHIAPSIGFPESHDTPRLAAELLAAGLANAEIERHYRLAYGFAAAFSKGVMLPMGFEYGWSRPLEVVMKGQPPREKKRFDISDFVAEANRTKSATPALNAEGPQRPLGALAEGILALLRETADEGERAIVLVNRQRQESRRVDLEKLAAAAGLSAGVELREVRRGEAMPVGDSLALPPLGLAVLRAAARRRVPQVGQHVLWRPEARIAIEEVYPELDGGRYPVKRIEGEIFEVWADIFRDGHDKLRAAVKYRHEDDAEWREATLQFFDNDRWVARFRLDRIGRWRYAIEAWTARFASWRDEVEKKRQAGQQIALELSEGRELVAAAMPSAAGSDLAHLAWALAEFETGDRAQHAEILLSAELAEAMARCESREDLTRYPRELEVVVDRERARFAAWYEMFPRSQGRVPGRGGNFDDCIARLPEIAALGFDVVYLVPIHPIGRINRKGKDNSVPAMPGDPGSPYAIGAAEGGHRAIHPELGTLADFRRLVAAAASLGMEVALDFAIQCAPDHPWVEEHPQWFRFRPDGSIKYAENPPKKYEDIVNVDFYNPDREALWRELREVVLFWIEQGVRIFRVDNPHTKPLPFWEWLIRDVQSRCPETIFFAEAFTRPKMMRALAKAGFTQSYTYFTWRNSKAELADYLWELTHGPAKEYFRPNFFTNTPDILSVILQEGGRPAFRMRLVLAATLSPAYGIYNGFELCENAALPGREEYRNSEKYEFKVWDWDRPGNIKEEIAALNRFRRANPALREFTNLHFLDCGDPHILGYAKATDDRSNIVCAIVNLDPFAAHEDEILLPLDEWGLAEDREFALEEAFTGRRIVQKGVRARLRLDPERNPAMLFRVTG
jgi:starch synthase (maltosyl-transferring)